MLFPHRKQSMGLLNWLAVFMWNLAWCCLVVFNISKAVWKVRQGQVNATKCSPQFACWSQFIKKKERNGLGGKRDPVNILQLVFWSSWLLVSASEIQSHWCSAIHYTVSLMPASPYNHMNFNSCISIRPIRILCKCVQMQIKPSVSHYVNILIGKEKQSSPPGCSTYPSVFLFFSFNRSTPFILSQLLCGFVRGLLKDQWQHHCMRAVFCSALRKKIISNSPVFVFCFF